MKHFDADPKLAAFVRNLPKTETHLHLEGSVSFEQIRDADPERYPEPPPFWQPDFRYAGFDHFQSMFDDWVIPYHNSVERYHQTAKHVFATCLQQGCRYVETSFHLPAVTWIETDGPELLAAILEAAPAGLEVRVFGGFIHTDYGSHGPLLEESLAWDALSGIDLHGPEILPVDIELPDYWRRARENGKVTKAHAGEFMPASFVDWVLDNLKVDRIEHGVRAIESAQVVEKLVERGVTLDVCPISNLKLGVEGINTMSDHPVKRLMDAGVRVSISTDDTFLFGNSLAEEYFALAGELGFGELDLVRVARTGFENALLDEPKKSGLLAELDAIAAQSVQHS